MTSQFDGTREDREEAIKGDKYSDVHMYSDGLVLILTVIWVDDQLTKQNLPFLITTLSRFNISINKKYGVYNQEP